MEGSTADDVVQHCDVAVNLVDLLLHLLGALLDALRRASEVLTSPLGAASMTTLAEACRALRAIVVLRHAHVARAVDGRIRRRAPALTLVEGPA